MPKPRALPDQAARDRIERELDRNLLVEAGAGSGKTESLARRMAAGIAAGRYAVQHMAAVTFTRKAAAELRGRFQLELERRLGEEADPERRARIEVALAQLERLFAGTIHAFCAHLLRERPVEAGVAPGFAELDDLEDALRRRAAWRRYCETERARGSARFAVLAEVGLGPRDLDQALDVVCRFPEVRFPAPATRMPDARAAARELRAFWSKLRPLVPDRLPDGARCQVLLRAAELRARLRVADLSQPAEVASLLDRWASPKDPVAKWWGAKPQSVRVRALVTEFARDVAGPFVSAWRQHCYRIAVEFLEGGRAAADAERRRSLALNYEDLLQLAARLLRERADVRAALQAKYQWLFVDEFQDTDSIQAEVICLLAATPDAGATGTVDWTRVGLRPGALFVVGDPKQSIYRFRRADIDTYARVRQRVEDTGGAVVPLTTSFRARPALCEWANTVFPNFFPRRPTPQQPAFDRLDPVRDAGDAGRVGVRQLIVPASVDRKAVVATEAASIARVIRAEVDAGHRAWGDFLVLTCRRRDLDAYARALEAQRVPVEVSGASGFAESLAVRVLADLLRALGDPADEPALIGVLRGRLFGLSDVELFRHRRVGLPLRLAIPIGDEAAGPVAEALQQLHAMYRWTRQLPLPAAVQRILEATGWLAAAVAGSPGGAEGGHLLHAVDRVRVVTEAGGTLADAAEALEADLESTEVESVPLEPGRRDVVRLMNLHKAKGLEAAVVFLAAPLTGLPEQVDVRIVRGPGAAEGYFRLVRRSEGSWAPVLLGEPADWAAHERAELTYLQAERRRLLYVAATRAKDLLVIGRWAGTGWEAGRPWEPFAPFLADAPQLRVPDAVAASPAASAPMLERRAADSAVRAARLETLRRPSWTVESVTGTAHRATVPGEPVQAGRTREPDTGMAWGTLVHALLEHAARGSSVDRAHLERVARWLTFDNAELRRVVPDALETVARVLASDLWEGARAAAELHAEVPFAVRLDGEDGSPPRVLHGVIDLAFRGPAGWELVDYKTDQVDVATLAIHYGDQVRQYSAHWAILTGAAVKYAGVYGVRSQVSSSHLGGRQA